MKNLLIIVVTSIAILVIASSANAQIALMDSSHATAPGWVGIGPDFDTSPPETVLHLRREGPTVLTLENTDASTGSTWRVNSAADGNLRFSDVDAGTAQVELTVTTSGELLAGSTVAIYSYVSGEASPQFWKWVLDSDSSTGDFQLKDNTGTTELELQKDGDLYITGSYYSNGTQLTVPDFVFEDDYSLLSLNELEQYIKTEKHLPNIPSATSIKEEGLNLTELQMQMLEKIEELTLHTITQQKLIDQQQQMIQELTSRLDTVAGTAAE